MVSGTVVFAPIRIHQKPTNARCVMFGKEHQPGLIIIEKFLAYSILVILIIIFEALS